ncbi:MAG: aspartate kinase, partial [Nitrososphaerota archaeon]
MRIVMKFGGSSLAEPDRMSRAADLVKATSDRNEVVVVCSGADDVTDRLVALVDMAKRGRSEYVEKTLGELESLHRRLLE